jgi:hypothetical protein
MEYGMIRIYQYNGMNKKKGTLIIHAWNTEHICSKIKKIFS